MIINDLLGEGGACLLRLLPAVGLGSGRASGIQGASRIPGIRGTGWVPSSEPQHSQAELPVHYSFTLGCHWKAGEAIINTKQQKLISIHSAVINGKLNKKSMQIC